MTRPFTSALVVMTTLFCVLAVSCGGMSGDPPRILQSISVSPAMATPPNQGQAQFTATGYFSAPPTVVTLLTVNWTITTPQPQCIAGGVPCFATIDSTGLAQCNGTGVPETIQASAPRDPSLPVGTPGVAMVTGTAQMTCAAP